MHLSSLKSKLLVAVCALVITSGLLISLLVTHRYSASLYESMSAQAENMAHVVALEATDKILINDLVSLQKTLDHHQRSNASVAYLFVHRDERVLAHTFENGMPQELIQANSPTAGGQTRFLEIAATTGEKFLDVAWPIFSGKAGILRLGLAEKPYRQQVVRLWLQMSLVTVAILAVALAASLLFIKKITRPLSALAQGAEKIDEDRLDLELEAPAGGEVGQLAQSFNRMLARIRDYTRRLEEKNLQLDRAHRQTRTSFLISQEINALSNLEDVCTYLLKKLQGIVTCKNMAVVISEPHADSIFIYSDGEAVSVHEKPAKALFVRLDAMDAMTFVHQNDIETGLFSPAFQAAEKLVAFPLRHEGSLVGGLLIACPGECTCVTKELDVIEMILDQSCSAIRRATAHEEELRELRTRIEQASGFSGIIGKDPKMQVIYKLIEDVAPTDATVLIQGESGTGKELVARAIHRQSLRRDRPFVVINCSAYPATLLESELFGHEKGAFTGAIRQKAGRFEQADGGTVFLDEIGEISPTAQIKLLRVLQSQKFERLGGESSLSVNVRILAATNKNLLQEVKAGRFREDLFYRLNVIPIQLPPLRKRRNDIPLLARHFLNHFAADQGRAVNRFSSEALRRLLDYQWPGNVRELENSIEHAVVLVRGACVEVSDMPAVLQQPAARAGVGSNGTMAANERRLLIEALQDCDWNKKRAALQLGISRSSLYEKLKKYQITRPTLH